MPSITTWTRLSPQQRSDDIERGLKACIHDPLWMLTRQWQFGEFQGEDAGSPVNAKATTSVSQLSRFSPGVSPGSENYSYHPKNLPLEVMVEREGKSFSDLSARTAAELGNQFLYTLEMHNSSVLYRSKFIAEFGFEKDSLEDELDGESLRFLRIVSGRSVDGRRLFKACNAANGIPSDVDFIDENRLEVNQAIQEWLAWAKDVVGVEVVGQDAWQPERLEYGFSVAAPFKQAGGQDEVVLAASEYAGGHLDWPSFRVMPGASLGAESDDSDSQEILTHSAIPAPLRFHGMPSARWWEMEDAHVDLGDIKAAPQDLARLLLVEFALLAGNDWFVIPVDLSVGSIATVDTVLVTNTFGETLEIEPSDRADPAAAWRMFKLSVAGERGEREAAFSALFLPPTLGPSLHSDPIEDVRFIRDEMANYAWAIEKKVERETTGVIDRHEAYQAQRQGFAAASTTDAPDETELVYRFSSEVPDFWFPLVPVQQQPGDPADTFRLGGLLQQDRSIPKPWGKILRELNDTEIFEEEVPRAGVHVLRQLQFARWVGGSSHLWTSRRKRPGRGEGSSGLLFDIADPALENSESEEE